MGTETKDFRGNDKMSIQSDAAKEHIEKLIRTRYGVILVHAPTKQLNLFGSLPQDGIRAFKEYRFDETRRWRMDYAVPEVMCAIEINGGNFIKGAHSNPTALRKSYEKLNRAAEMGWRVWQFMPEQVIRAGRKTIPDEPILKELPWV